MGCNCTKNKSNYHIGRVIKDKITGALEYAPEDIVRERRTICNTCERYRAILDQCGACLCIVKFKIQIAQSDCPLDKWSAYDKTSTIS